MPLCDTYICYSLVKYSSRLFDQLTSLDDGDYKVIAQPFGTCFCSSPVNVIYKFII